VPLAHPALEALWALHQAGWLDDATALSALEHPSAPVRAWAIRLVGDRKQLPENFATAVKRLALTEPDAEVRCQIASTARRLPARQAPGLVATLLRLDADSSDPFIPLLCWWTIEGFCDTDRAAVLAMFELPNLESPSPLGGGRGENTNDLRSLWNSTLAKQHILPRVMRRFAAKSTRADLLVCAQFLSAAPTDDHRKLLAAGFEDAFRGRALPPLPDELLAALAKSGHSSLLLGIRRDDIHAVQQALALVTDPKAKREDRLLHIRAFGEVHQPTAVPVLLDLAKSDGDLDLRKTALAALSRYDNTKIGTEIAASYANLPPALQLAAQGVLTSRPAWSLAFLKLIEDGGVKTTNVSAEAVARLHQHAEKSVADLTAKLFPKPSAPIRPDTRAAVERIQRVLKAGAGNPYGGESIFTERCALCHQLFHKGGRIGPNLTTYQRDDLSTMLPSILDPNAEIREGYANYLVETKDGRALSGFIAAQDANVIALRGFDGEDLSLARPEILELKPTGMSLMPEGLLEGLTDQQLRDFFAYLCIPQPISR
jgi:putative heme-binding domain-containing protein